jgi:DNA-binding NarL/FixJ family response regulator
MLRILIADDQWVFRENLRTLIDRHTAMKVVGEAEDGWSAYGMAYDLAPDVVVMDVNMPDMNGVEATKSITARVPGVKVIALSMHSDKRFVSRMIEAGASGYILKECAFEELITAIRSVAKNRKYFSSEIAAVVKKTAQPTATSTGRSGKSARAPGCR